MQTLYFLIGMLIETSRMRHRKCNSLFMNETSTSNSTPHLRCLFPSQATPCSFNFHWFIQFRLSRGRSRASDVPSVSLRGGMLLNLQNNNKKKTKNKKTLQPLQRNQHKFLKRVHFTFRAVLTSICSLIYTLLTFFILFVLFFDVANCIKHKK